MPGVMCLSAHFDEAGGEATAARVVMSLGDGAVMLHKQESREPRKLFNHEHPAPHVVVDWRQASVLTGGWDGKLIYSNQLESAGDGVVKTTSHALGIGRVRALAA